MDRWQGWQTSASGQNESDLIVFGNAVVYIELHIKTQQTIEMAIYDTKTNNRIYYTNWKGKAVLSVMSFAVPAVIKCYET